MNYLRMKEIFAAGFIREMNRMIESKELRINTINRRSELPTNGVDTLMTKFNMTRDEVEYLVLAK